MKSVTTQSISQSQAQAVMEATLAEAHRRGTRVNIAVVDSAADLKAFVRMDDAWLGTIDVAIKKARTAALFRMSTASLGPLVQPGAPLFGLDDTNEGLITFGGGEPLVSDDGTVIGAVGVSGSTVENDEATAKVGASALGS